MASTYWKQIAGDSRYTQNIQIKKLLVKMKNVSFILWKKLNELLGQPSSVSVVLLALSPLDHLPERSP